MVGLLYYSADGHCPPAHLKLSKFRGAWTPTMRVLNCSQTMVRLYCFPLFPINHVVVLVVLLFLLLFFFSNYGFIIQEILSWQPPRPIWQANQVELSQIPVLRQPFFFWGSRGGERILYLNILMVLCSSQKLTTLIFSKFGKQPQQSKISVLHGNKRLAPGLSDYVVRDLQAVPP